MKTGIEVEGRFRGLRTLFTSASEYLELTAEGRLAALMAGHSHLYVSDHSATLQYADLQHAALDNKVVTLEVDRLPNGLRPSNLTIMLRVPGHADVMAMLPTDMFKFTRDNDRTVKVGTVGSLMHTDEQEFGNDEELR